MNSEYSSKKRQSEDDLDSSEGSKQAKYDSDNKYQNECENVK
jgi:hypothetical protein